MIPLGNIHTEVNWFVNPVCHRDLLFCTQIWNQTTNENPKANSPTERFSYSYWLCVFWLICIFGDLLLFVFKLIILKQHTCTKPLENLMLVVKVGGAWPLVMLQPLVTTQDILPFGLFRDLEYPKMINTLQFHHFNYEQIIS